ncbi:uncharacterized protein BX664DRAFT_339470, partial [Halteromyces radiatus]|uniref:uncharacterized protein n=1 Tax=Halteromyces radiatus TaxID=101107 RepID=UPI00221E3B25
MTIMMVVVWCLSYSLVVLSRVSVVSSSLFLSGWSLSLSVSFICLSLSWYFLPEPFTT